MTNRLNFRTPEQSRNLHRLIRKLNIDKEVKEELVYEYSEGRTSSSTGLKIYEADKLIEHLKKLERELDLKTQANKVSGLPSYDTPENKQRRKIFAICHEMRWTYTEGKVDKKRLNEWMLKYSYLHKPLNKYELLELPKLITQFEELLKHFYAKR